MANKKTEDTETPESTETAPPVGVLEVEGSGPVRIRRVEVEDQAPILAMSVLKTVRGADGKGRPVTTYVLVEFDGKKSVFAVDVETAASAIRTGLFEVHPDSKVKLKVAQTVPEEVTDASK